MPRPTSTADSTALAGADSGKAAASVYLQVSSSQNPAWANELADKLRARGPARVGARADPRATRPTASCSARTPRGSRRRRPAGRSACRPSSCLARTRRTADVTRRPRRTHTPSAGHPHEAHPAGALRLQVVRGHRHPDLRAGRHRHRRPQRLRQVQRLRRGALGAGRAVGPAAPRRQDGGRDLPGLHRRAGRSTSPRSPSTSTTATATSPSPTARWWSPAGSPAPGQSDYLLNGSPVRLRDIQDLLRGTGLGSDAGVVIEAKMIDLLLSDRADERRSLFEEAAGIGLYRDRKHSTERRLEETATDLQRVEDLIAEVQSQIRSLARQRGKAERHVKLTEEKFAVQVTLARRLLERLSEEAAGMEARFAELAELLPAARQRLRRRRAAPRGGGARPRRRRGAADRDRAPPGRRPGRARQARRRPRPGRPSGWPTPPTRRQRAQEERRADGAAGAAGRCVERDAAAADRDAAAVRARAHPRRARRPRRGRGGRPPPARRAARAGARSGSRSCRRRPRRCARSRASARRSRASSPRSASGPPAPRRIGRHSRASWPAPSAGATTRSSGPGFLSHEAKRAAADAEHARHLVAEAREQEAMHRSDRRRAEEALAQMTARRHALEELERDRVGPGARRRGAARRARAVRRRRARARSAISSAPSRDDAELAERLLGDWMHAVLVRDRDDGATRSRPGTPSSSPARWCCCRSIPGPLPAADGQPLDDRLRAEGPAAGVGAGGARRVARCSTPRAGCSAARAAPSSSPARPRRRARSAAGPSSRRSARTSSAATAALAAAESALAGDDRPRWPSASRALAAATAAAEQAREAERQGAAATRGRASAWRATWRARWPSPRRSSPG